MCNDCYQTLVTLLDINLLLQSMVIKNILPEQ